MKPEMIQEEAVDGVERVRLYRKFIVNLVGLLLPMGLGVLVWMRIVPFPFLGVFFLFWLMDLFPGDRFFLTKDYIQRNDKKVLNWEIESVERILFWYVITDKFRARISIPYAYLTPESKTELDRWLADDPDSRSNNSDDLHPFRH